VGFVAAGWEGLLSFARPKRRTLGSRSKGDRAARKAVVYRRQEVDEMSGQDNDDNKVLYMRGAIIAGALVLAVLLGLWLGNLSVPDNVPVMTGTPELLDLTSTAIRRESYVDPYAPPFYFYAGARTPQEWVVVAGEAAIAASVGQHQYVVPIAVPWLPFMEIGAAQLALDALIAADSEASFLLELDLNPPDEWFSRLGETRLAGQEEGRAYPSLASANWRRDGEEGITQLIQWIEREGYGNRVIGYVLAGLEDGRWTRNGPIDKSQDNEEAFQAWLAGIYNDDQGLRSAWGPDAPAIFSVSIPEPPSSSDTSQVFFRMPSEYPSIDFQRFSSEYTADTIAAFAALIREVSTTEPKVYANYGYSLELESNLSGHFGLGLLMNSDLDGFISPVSYVDRGLGGAGGFMGPVDSARYHGKEWLIMDDTRTGVSKDPLSGEIGRLRGLRADDVFNVQRRNFAAAAIHGLGMIWADPRGEGWLHDQEQWEILAGMQGIYMGLYGAQGSLTESQDGEYVPDATPRHSPDLIVVVDEMSRFVQRNAQPLNSMLLQGGRDGALRAGVSTHFALLQDVLDDRTPPTGAYLFLNAFRLSEAERNRLHDRFTAEQACAIWLYAPGYFENNQASIANISKTVMMNVRAFDKPQLGGSAFKLAGGWMKADEPFGAPVEWSPLFYIDDPEADTLAEYQAVSRTSAALRFLPEGWTSVFIAEPAISPGLLRELFRILEYSTNFRPSARSQLDTVHLGEGLMAIHGRQTGETSINLPESVTAIDLFEPDIGWASQSSFLMPLKTGETRFLQFHRPDAVAVD